MTTFANRGFLVYEAIVARSEAGHADAARPASLVADW